MQSIEKVITKGNIESYFEGLEHAARICDSRKRGRVSSDAAAIRKEITRAQLLARRNHGLNVPSPTFREKTWKDYLRETTWGERLTAFFIVSLPALLSWSYYLLTGNFFNFNN